MWFSNCIMFPIWLCFIVYWLSSPLLCWCRCWCRPPPRLKDKHWGNLKENKTKRKTQTPVMAETDTYAWLTHWCGPASMWLYSRGRYSNRQNQLHRNIAFIALWSVFSETFRKERTFEIDQTDWTRDEWLTSLRALKFPSPSFLPWSGRGGVFVCSGGRVCAVPVGGVRGGVVPLQVFHRNPTVCFTVTPRLLYTGHTLYYTPTTIHLSGERNEGANHSNDSMCWMRCMCHNYVGVHAEGTVPDFYNQVISSRINITKLNHLFL